MPVVVYNYLDKPQTVELTLTDGTLVQAARRAGAEDRAGGRRSAQRRLPHPRREGRAFRVGGIRPAAAAWPTPSSGRSRSCPTASRVEQVFNGTLQQPAEIACSVPPQAIEGSVKAIVKIYPSSFSQLVEGLDAIFQRPYGCFEQTSSTTYPNVLALDYLRQNKKSLPEVEAKARQYIHLGYQRLLSFEVAGGGFDWFGNPPGESDA